MGAAEGKKNEAGADVRVEPSNDALAAPRITLYTGGSVRPDGGNTAGEREFTLVAEAMVPVDLDDAFFFSGRRRHTRWNCDWSSDVCSSDLDGHTTCDVTPYAASSWPSVSVSATRSEERRVGKEYRTRWAPPKEKKTRPEPTCASSHRTTRWPRPASRSTPVAACGPMAAIPQASASSRWWPKPWCRSTWTTRFFFQAEDGIRDGTVTGVQTCALPISTGTPRATSRRTPPARGRASR